MGFSQGKLNQDVGGQHQPDQNPSFAAKKAKTLFWTRFCLKGDEEDKGDVYTARLTYR